MARAKVPVDGKPVLVRLSPADRAALEEVAESNDRDLGELLRLYAMPRVRAEAQHLRRGEQDESPPLHPAPPARRPKERESR